MTIQESSIVHIPVLLSEVLNYLSPCHQKTYVDATFGGGGYTRAILESARCKVIGIDRDSEAQQRAWQLQRDYPDRFQFFLSNFANLDRILNQFDGIVFDFGVSSFQLEESQRGFSFQIDGPLDMRMDQSHGITAAEVVNTFSENYLRQIIQIYGDEPSNARIAHTIVQNRPFRTTLELAKAIHKVSKKQTAIDSATKTFQALRIFVNDELKEIDEALKKIVKLVRGKNLTGVRVVTVAFHSLEDRIVKRWIRQMQFDKIGGVNVQILTPKIVKPLFQEQKLNPRCRSARLRAVIINSQEVL